MQKRKLRTKTPFRLPKPSKVWYDTSMTKIDEIQGRLREALQYTPLSQKEIAAKLGVDPSTVSKYARGCATPSLDAFAALCEILDVSADEILGLK